MSGLLQWVLSIARLAGDKLPAIYPHLLGMYQHGVSIYTILNDGAQISVPRMVDARPSEARDLVNLLEKTGADSTEVQTMVNSFKELDRIVAAGGNAPAAPPPSK